MAVEAVAAAVVLVGFSGGFCGCARFSSCGSCSGVVYLCGL